MAKKSGKGSSIKSFRAQKEQQNQQLYASSNDSLFGFLYFGIGVYLIYSLSYWAYRIRLHAIEEYGAVIHEFDPYFNYRATEYLYEHGWKKFFTWFDYMVWYPLGRPVGSTIYPGMQFTAVFIKNYLTPSMSLNDVCVYMPAWFGSVATLVTGLIAYECALPQNSHTNLLSVLWDALTGQLNDPPYKQKPILKGIVYTPALECGIMAMAIMSVVPAHLMRSVGGGYDNESVAMTAMVLTFYCWIRSLRNDAPYSWWWGIPTGLAYFYMVAAWGGYIFVLNMVGLHAALLVLLGRFQTKIYLSYSLFYTVGTLLAIQVPVVGWSPLKSLEQLGPCAVFVGYQGLQFCEIVRKRQKLSRGEAWKLRVRVTVVSLVGLVAAIWLMAPKGYFGPLSARVRGLFVQHTKTGNPLVDSVAEHQPASNQAYFQYLHYACSLAPIGYVLVLFCLSDSSSFLLAWGMAGYYFSNRMVRLILLTAPIASILGGIAAGHCLAWCLRQIWDSATGTTGTGGDANGTIVQDEIPTASNVTNGNSQENGGGGKSGKEGKRKRKKNQNSSSSNNTNNSSSSSFDGLKALKDMVDKATKSQEGIIFCRTLAVLLLVLMYMIGSSFKNYSWRLAKDLSHPSIIVMARTRDGRVVKVDDYREAYWWVRDNTPEDARIMAWWDYGYQITAIANRTTIADGNTWNHEHIALLGKALTTDIEEGHEIAKHLADYVLLWGGGGGDDLAKSPHLARIANSVYRDHCPRDPTCRAFGFMDRRGTPSPMMERSLLYQLHSHMIKPGVVVDPDLFEEVFRSKYGRVRVFKVLDVVQESKRWVADPANRRCDVEGSWFCPGRYPPGLSNILSRKKDFAQLEDFNRGDSDEQYQKEYFEALKNPEKAREQAIRNEAYRRQAQKLEQRKVKRVTVNQDGSVTDHGEAGGINLNKAKLDEWKTKKDAVYTRYEDTEDTTLMWSMIHQNEVENIQAWLEDEPLIGYIRSRDGRGPMWWAFEKRNQEIVKLLMKFGIPHTDKDVNGLTPVDLLQGTSLGDDIF